MNFWYILIQTKVNWRYVALEHTRISTQKWSIISDFVMNSTWEREHHSRNMKRETYWVSQFYTNEFKKKKCSYLCWKHANWWRWFQQYAATLLFVSSNLFTSVFLIPEQSLNSHSGTYSKNTYSFFYEKFLMYQTGLQVSLPSFLVTQHSYSF